MRDVQSDGVARTHCIGSCTGKGAPGRPGGLRFRRPAAAAGFPAVLGRVAPRRNSLRARLQCAALEQLRREMDERGALARAGHSALAAPRRLPIRPPGHPEHAFPHHAEKRPDEVPPQAVLERGGQGRDGAVSRSAGRGTCGRSACRPPREQSSTPDVERALAVGDAWVELLRRGGAVPSIAGRAGAAQGGRPRSYVRHAAATSGRRPRGTARTWPGFHGGHLTQDSSLALGMSTRSR